MENFKLLPANLYPNIDVKDIDLNLNLYLENRDKELKRIKTDIDNIILEMLSISIDIYANVVETGEKYYFVDRKPEFEEKVKGYRVRIKEKMDDYNKLIEEHNTIVKKANYIKSRISPKYIEEYGEELKETLESIIKDSNTRNIK